MRLREELDEQEATALHKWIGITFDDFRRRAAATFSPWYFEGAIPWKSSDEARSELAAAVFLILRELTPREGFVHFADIEHDYARFYPHRADAVAFDVLFVDGETSGYIAVDRTWGFVSTGWSKRFNVCFFGEPFVSRLRAREPALLNDLIAVEV